MPLAIELESLDRIEGKEGRSKLLATQSELYQVLNKLKQTIRAEYDIKPDRMDLHVEVTKQRNDPDFRKKAESIHQQNIDLANENNWGFLGRAFVLWAPEVEDYGRTHITIAFFGNYPKPTLDTLYQMIASVVK